MLLAILLISHVVSAYQLAKVYCYFLNPGMPATALIPPVFLVMSIASLIVLWWIRGRSVVLAALTIVSMLVLSAFGALLCKVVMVIQGQA
ncbi:MAG: hypothetical protein RLZZ214_20 [Verrucomicrobiota bacterium]